MLLAAGTLHKLPEREGDIRLIEIDEIDLNACGGTHVRATGQIGGLLIRGTERMRQGIRVEFVCGMRAAVTARRDLATLTRAAAALSVGRLEVADAVERLLAEGKAAHKARQKLTEEMAGYHASMLMLEYPLRDRAAECCGEPLPTVMPTISSCWRRGWWHRLGRPARCWPPPRRNLPGW
jgi:alanyl-tRNA synthetase